MITNAATLASSNREASRGVPKTGTSPERSAIAVSFSDTVRSIEALSPTVMLTAIPYALVRDKTALTTKKNEKIYEVNKTLSRIRIRY